MSLLIPRPPALQRQVSSTSSADLSTSSSMSHGEAQLLTPALGGDHMDFSGLSLASPTSPTKERYSAYSQLSPKLSLGSRSPVFAKASPREEGRVMSELDTLAYTYALRVAALYTHLHPPAPPSPPVPLQLAVSPSLPSPQAHRKSFSFRKASPPANPGAVPAVPAIPSGSSAASGDLKLPKEYLIELWGVLATEPGDETWIESKRTFLAGIKKGSRNERGGNLREVGVLLDTFLACIPSTCSSAHIHQTHLLHLLSTSLPRSAYFSSASRPQSEKDRDLLRKLRGEVAGYMLQAPAPVSASPQPDQGSHEGAIAQRSQTEMGEMEATVGLVFGLGRERIQRDLKEMGDGASMDELHIAHLQQMIAHFESLPSLTNSQRQRHAECTSTLSRLTKAHPHLVAPQYTGFASPSTFFVPPRKMEVYSHLCELSENNITLQHRSNRLVDECVRVWAVPGEEEREAEVESLIVAWRESLGSRDEDGWGILLEEGVGDLRAGRDPAEPLGPGLDHLLDGMVDMLGIASAEILADSHTPRSARADVRAPPVSLLPLLSSGEGIFLRQDRLLDRLDEIRDELKGAAVSEYVAAVEWLMGGVGGASGSPSGSPMLGGGLSQDQGLEQIKGYTQVAQWIEGIMDGLQKTWGEGLGELYDPAPIILSKQLSLFFAELQMLDPSCGIGSDAVFTLYEITGRLSKMWSAMCPEMEHGFEVDAFFEPYIIAWLKETEASRVHEWVSRAVAMDSWKLESNGNHSSSLTDLFACIRQTLNVILKDLPLSSSKRALYLTDVARSATEATTQYSTTLQALFQVDMTPKSAASEVTAKLHDKIGGKAGSWLAKGQQAMKTLERKKVEGFVIPPSAIVKLSNIGACSESISAVLAEIKPDKIARELGTKSRPAQTPRHVFTITLVRAQNLLAKNQNKAVDVFAVVSDGNERLLKTRTVTSTEEPRWDQSTDIALGATKHIEIALYDRSLVGKHDLIGVAVIKLDPKSWSNGTCREAVLPLSPRGLVYLRIGVEGGDKDIKSAFAGVSRTLHRAQDEMMNDVVERMMEYLRDQLSSRTLSEMTKPKDKKKPRIGEAEMDASLGGVYHYLNTNFSTFSSVLSDEPRIALQLKLWHRLLEHLTSLLVPPLSDRPALHAPTPAAEVEIVLKWLQLLKAFFNAKEGATEHGVKLTMLQGGVYKDVMMLGQYLDLPTPVLKERAQAAVKGVVARVRGDERGLEEGEKMAEVLLRIMRTRPDSGEFLSQQIGALIKAKLDRQVGLF